MLVVHQDMELLRPRGHEGKAREEPPPAAPTPSHGTCHISLTAGVEPSHMGRVATSPLPPGHPNIYLPGRAISHVARALYLLRV